MDCPYCSDRLVRHIQHQQLYWFCRSCWDRIPIASVEACRLNAKLHASRGSAGLVHPRTHVDTASYRSLKERMEERIAVVQEVA